MVAVRFAAQSQNGEGLVLMCKKAGLWTNRLFDVARRAEYGEAAGKSPNVKVLVEGPYGARPLDFSAPCWR